MTSRRHFISAAVPGLLTLGWPSAVTRAWPHAGQAGDGRLLSRPRRPTAPVQPGLRPLGLTAGRDGSLYVPASYRADRPAPFVLALHGAGGGAQGPLNLWRPLADEHGFVVLSPDSRGPTWDAVRGGFGADVSYIDRALADVFSRCAIDPARMTISGFSDGASYALSLGLTNGDLFRRVVAFSPGFIVPAEWRGTPTFFISHGRSDPILPIEATSRRIVFQLQRGGYSVRYREFDGGHEVPPDIRAAAVAWMREA